MSERHVPLSRATYIEPTFEADFCAHSYGFPPKRSAHDAGNDIEALWAGYTPNS